MSFKSIMVIDDSFYDRFIAQEMIEDHIPVDNIVCFESAAEALHYLKSRENNPDELPEVILLDIRMPVMDGFKFLDKFGELPPVISATCKIFILSSSIDPYDRSRANQHPLVLEFLTKPLSKTRIELMIACLNRNI